MNFNIVRKSIGRKLFTGIVLYGVFALAGYCIATQMYNINDVSLNTILVFHTLFVGLVCVIFYQHILRRINFLYNEITSLLSGKPYKRVYPKGIDQISVITHFYNQITKDLESVTSDIKKGKRLSSEVEIAHDIQSDVLPNKAEGIVGLDVMAKTKSATEVGGDSFDFIKNKDNTYIYIGDVTGHGVPSGVIMMIVNTLIHVFCNKLHNSRDVIVETNKFLAPRISQNLFMTFALLRWNEKEQKMYYTGAGHEHILIYRAESQEVEALRTGGIALGMVPNIEKIVQEKEIPLNINDSIILYSDGITEAKNYEGEMYGLSRLIDSINRSGYRTSSEAIFEKITSEFSQYVKKYKQIDDVTLIVIKYTGKDSPVVENINLSIGKGDEDDQDENWRWE